MPGQTLLRKGLDIRCEIITTFAFRDDKGFDHLAAFFVRHADDGRLVYVGMLQQHVLDLHRAHCVPGRDDHVIGAAAVEVETIRILTAQILSREPFAPAHHHDLTRRSRRTGTALCIVNGQFDTRHRLTQRPGFDIKIFRAWIGHQDHTHFGGSVETTCRRPEGLPDPLIRLRIQGFPGKR